VGSNPTFGTIIRADDRGAGPQNGAMPATRRFIGYPTDSLLAVMPDGARAAAAAAALHGLGIPDRDVSILRGSEGSARVDPTGAIHGLVARLRRIVSFAVMDQLPDMAWYDAAIRAGQAVVMVRVRGDAAKADAIRILQEHGGHFINYYGRFATEEIVRWQGPEPAVADLMRR
jgi:hypothetical protein